MDRSRIGLLGFFLLLMGIFAIGCTLGTVDHIIVSYGQNGAVSGAVVTFLFNGPPSLESQYLWIFGDGSTGFGNPVTHVFSQSGTYQVEVSVAIEGSLLIKFSTSISVSSSGTPISSHILYWGSNSEDTIRSCPIGSTPCVSTIIADDVNSGVDRAFGLQVAGNDLYWANYTDSTIRKCTIGSSPCSSTILADSTTSGVSFPTDIEIIGGTLYWVNEGDNTIRRCDMILSPCTSTIIADNATSGASTPETLEVVGGTLYWVNLGGNTIRSCPIGSSPCIPTIVADFTTSGLFESYGFNIIGSTLFWANIGDSKIRSCPVGTSPCISTIVADSPVVVSPVIGLYVIDDRVYWTNGDSTIRSCPFATTPCASAVVHADFGTSEANGPYFIFVGP